MHIALLGRQPELSIAELERVFSDVTWFSDTSALINTDQPIDIQRLGGSQKIGTVIKTLPLKDWRATSMSVVRHYQQLWREHEGKITLGISAYGFAVQPRDVQKTGLVLKAKLKESGPSLRLIPNAEAALSTATSHHNKLGLSENKIELLIIKGDDAVIIAESTGTQNISALAARDQGRPRRDAFVGMLPPKLALMMINFAHPTHVEKPRLLDPFCGTGVVLQEAMLLGYTPYGTDLAEKMVRYSHDNLAWLKDQSRLTAEWLVAEGDAMTTTWKQPVNAVVSEAYLGQPFSAPPSSSKLTEVRGNCNHIIGTFLKNLRGQLTDDTPVVIAVPAWRNQDGSFTRLPLVRSVEALGYMRVALQTVNTEALLYFRPDQVVARDILILKPTR